MEETLVSGNIRGLGAERRMEQIEVEGGEMKGKFTPFFFLWWSGAESWQCTTFQSSSQAQRQTGTLSR